MLRIVVALLLLANLVFFAWTRGALAPGFPPPRHAEREPERLIAQLNPQAVTVLPASAANAAVIAARATDTSCMEAGPLAETGIAAAEAALAPAQLPEGSWQREPAPPPPLWLVTVGRIVDADARRTREAELRKRGLAFELLQSPSDLAPALVLSRHATRADAEAALAVLNAASQPLKGAKVVSLPPPPLQPLMLRVRNADSEQLARLRALPAAALAGGFRPCAAVP